MLYQPRIRDDQVRAIYQLKVQLKQPMTKIVREAIDCYLRKMEDKDAHAQRAGTTLPDWLAYEQDMDEASAAAKQVADLGNGNAPF